MEINLHLRGIYATTRGTTTKDRQMQQITCGEVSPAPGQIWTDTPQDTQPRKISANCLITVSLCISLVPHSRETEGEGTERKKIKICISKFSGGLLGMIPETAGGWTSQPCVSQFLQPCSSHRVQHRWICLLFQPRPGFGHQGGEPRTGIETSLLFKLLGKALHQLRLLRHGQVPRLEQAVIPK